MEARLQPTSTFPHTRPGKSTPLVRSLKPTTGIRHTKLTRLVINIHGGAFMLGHSRMVSLPQVEDCLARGWIVVVPNHRLCPGVNILEGPMQDIRDLLNWIQDGHLDSILSTHGYRADLDNIAAFGTSSGGHLALSLVSIHLNALKKRGAVLIYPGLRRPQTRQGNSLPLRRCALL